MTDQQPLNPSTQPAAQPTVTYTQVHPDGPRRTRRGRATRTALIAGAAAFGLASVLGVGAAAYTASYAATSVAEVALGGHSTVVEDWGQVPGSTGGSGTGSSSTGGTGTGVLPGRGSGSGSSPYGSGSGSTGTRTSTQSSAVAASAAQTAGVVTIVSDLSYQGAQSAGTGIILSSDGMILTNNHVIEGSTSIEVTVESTGASYTATVVGTDATHDIAVLQLSDASGLTTASLDESDSVAVGDAVTAVGNAEGTGDLVAASGTVTALEQTITTQSEYGVSGETLNGLIQVDARIVSGDSGGPLVDAEGEVVGIDTAASSGSAQVTGFAIPISDALDIVAQIEAGADTQYIEIGYPGFLGIGVAETGTGSGAGVASVIEGTPAAGAGLVAGDVITAVNGTPITGAAELTSVLGAMEPGETVSLNWTTASGTADSADVTLIAGPAA
ncbi:S1C family serine protease [Herbiconiux sp. P18]|uniref:S1C family serine protease n=1 Tax=Herbiconiux liangxiaofengii TaxID=3342795 RepID=UPI0035B9ABEB